MVNFYTGNKPTPGVSELRLYREFQAEQKKKHSGTIKKQPNTASGDEGDVILDAEDPVSNILKEPVSSNRKITVREYHLWKASGSKSFDDYLDQKPHIVIDLPKWPPVKDLPGLPGGADDPGYLEFMEKKDKEELRRVRKYGKSELKWPSRLL